MEVGKDGRFLVVRTRSSYKEGQGRVCRMTYPLALGCAIKHARRLNHELIDEVQDDAVMWTRDFPDCYGTYGCPARLDCNAPMFDIDEDHWRTSWGMHSCWTHAALLNKNVA